MRICIKINEGRYVLRTIFGITENEDVIEIPCCVGCTKRNN